MKNLFTNRMQALVLIFYFITPFAYAQERTVSGTVTDSNGGPLPGVSILIEGTSRGTTSDADGNYSLAVPDTESTLIFSFVGYTTERMVVGNQSEINISLIEDISQLEELVVVGYGTQQKRDVTGAISQVKGQDFENLPVASSSQALQGRAAGVQVIRNGGAPGNTGSIRIRGTGTINNAEPLIIIDGFPGSSLDDVNPNDIESMEVLKDASASAIYGTRAANGVIIVTTKRGKTNENLKLSLNAYTGVSNAIKTVDVLDAPTLAQLKRERYVNDGLPIDPIWEDPQYQVQRTDWQDELLDQGITQNIDLNLRGGGESSSFNMSLGYFNEEGMMKNSFFERFSLRLNSDHKINKRLNIGQSLQLTSRKGNFLNTNSAQTGVLWSAIRFQPSLPVIDADGNYGSSQVSGEFGDINNPIFTVDTEDDQETRHRILGTLYAELEIIKDLKLRANFGIDGEIFDRDNFEIIINDQIRARDRNSLIRSYRETYSLLAEYFLSYQKTFAEKHTAGIVGGYAAQTFDEASFLARRRDFPDEAALQRYLDAGNTIDNAEGNRTYDGLESWFARANYEYDNRYLLTLTFRADGSSRFDDGNKWGYFPSFSAGWRISEESFWNVGLISDLKLVGGWGELGNQNVDRNQFLALIATGERYSFGGEQTVGAAQSRIPNPNITWETVQMTNFGVEIGFLQNQVLADINYFIKDTKDMLLPVPVIGSQGQASVPDRNFGEMRNQGLEMELSYRGNKGDLSYRISGNASIIRNEVTRLNAPFLETRRYGRPNEEIARVFPNEPLSPFYGWVADGIYQNTNEISADPSIANDPRNEAGLIQPGDVRFVDLNGDGLIDENDRTIIGDPNPELVYGLNAGVNYKGFDLNLFFLGSAGHEIFNADRMQGIDPTYPFNMYAETTGRWTGEGTSNTIPRMTTRRDNLNHRSSTLFIENGGFFRLKNVTLGYTIPSELTSRIGISRARFYVTGQNVFTITDYSGMDPELGYVDNNLQLNVDYAQYPQARTWTLGTTIDF
ncbi:MAG: TonB-dependent receptor [Cytophagales bacterium]|nr:TonB-dependent receptor [Cytophagales bacterium]